MDNLEDITITVVHDKQNQNGLSTQVLAILHEISGYLDELAKCGKQQSIDIRSLPMLPDEYQALKNILGQGEVMATVAALGDSEIRETAIPGVWWVTHRNSENDVMAEFIEITSIPAMLKSSQEDLNEAGKRLQQRILQHSDP